MTTEPAQTYLFSRTKNAFAFDRFAVDGIRASHCSRPFITWASSVEPPHARLSRSLHYNTIKFVPAGPSRFEFEVVLVPGRLAGWSEDRSTSIVRSRAMDRTG